MNTLAATILALGLVNWIATTILVESEITRPFRDWLTKRRDVNKPRPEINWASNRNRKLSRRYARWDKLRYLAGCHLCTGTWVGLALAVVVPVRPFESTLGTFVDVVLAGLLIKAIGHLTLVLHKAGEAVTR